MTDIDTEIKRLKTKKQEKEKEQKKKKELRKLKEEVEPSLFTRFMQMVNNL